MVIGDIRPIELSCNVNVGFSLDNELLKYPSDNRGFFVQTLAEAAHGPFSGPCILPSQACLSNVASHQPSPCEVRT